MSAPVIEQALDAAAPGTADLVIEKHLARWSIDDPQSAARFAELQADPFLREVALRVVAQTWAKHSPVAAARWAESLGDGTERDRALENVALTLAGSNARAALELLGRRGADKAPDSARLGVIVSWARIDFATALRWVEAQPRSPARDDIVQRLLLEHAADHPLEAVTLADRMIADVAARRDAWATLARLWAAKDPGLVRNWAASADPDTRRRIEAELIRAGGE
jgi:hypothetical protein